MTPELQKKLFDKYPDIFARRKLSMQETCMCWGIETGDGWFKLLDELCGKLKFLVDTFSVSIEATQVKEKFGTLHFYYQVSHPPVDSVRVDAEAVLYQIISDLVAEAERISEHTCEDCGEYGSTNRFGWVKTRCEDHTSPEDRKISLAYDKYKSKFYARLRRRERFYNEVWFLKRGISGIIRRFCRLLGRY